jgi:hypothetical protein
MFPCVPAVPKSKKNRRREMPKQKRLKLESLKVTSFLTSEEARNIKGMTDPDTNCADTDCGSINPMNDCWDLETYNNTCGCPVTGNYTCPPCGTNDTATAFDQDCDACC